MTEHNAAALADDKAVEIVKNASDVYFSHKGDGAMIAMHKSLLSQISAALRTPIPVAVSDWSQTQAAIVACLRETWPLITDGLAKEDFFAASAVLIQDRLRAEPVAVSLNASQPKPRFPLPEADIPARHEECS